MDLKSFTITKRDVVVDGIATEQDVKNFILKELNTYFEKQRVVKII